MSSAPSQDPEHRWRRAVEKRGRPLKVAVAELGRDFGYATVDTHAGDDIEDRLAHAGVHVRPPLVTVARDALVTLELMMPGPDYEPSPTSDFPALSAPETTARSDGRLSEPDDPWSEDAVWSLDDRPGETKDLGPESVADRDPWVDRDAPEDPVVPHEPDARDEPDAWNDPEAWDAPDARVEADARDEPDAWDEAGVRVEADGWDEPAAPGERPAGDAPLSEPLEAEPRQPRRIASGHVSPRPARPPGATQARDRRLLLGALLLVPAALALAGYAIGHRPQRPAAAPAALSGPATRAGVGLRRPAGWELRTSAPQIPGLRFRSPLVLAPGGPLASAIVAGLVTDAVGSDLLPAGLRKRLADDVPPPETVLLGDIQALRYQRLRLAGYADAVTLFAVPTGAGSVIIACHAPIEDGAFFGDCERSAATLALGALPQRARAMALAPSRGYGRRVASAIAAVGGAIGADGARLRRARTASGQSTIARAIARSLSRTAAELDAAAVSARDREGHAALVAAIRADAGAYDDLATAASAADAGGYANASDGVRRADARVRASAGALRKLGYG